MNEVIPDLPRILMPVSGPGRLLLGPLCHLRIRKAGLPAFLVREPAARHYRRILLPTSYSSNSRDAARLALSMPSLSQLAVLHAYGGAQGRRAAGAIDSLPALRASALQRMEDFVAPLRHAPLLLSTAVHVGHPERVVPAYARRMRADLVVIAYKREFALWPDHCSRLLYRLLQETECDVLLTWSFLPGARQVRAGTAGGARSRLSHQAVTPP